MKRASYIFRVEFPIEDADMPLASLKAQAIQRATQYAHSDGLEPIGLGNLHVEHGANAQLTVRMPVVGQPVSGRLQMEVT